MRPSTRRRVVVAGAVLLALAGVAGVAAGASEASLSTVNGTVRVHAVEDATVRGTTDLDPGANVSVRVQSSGDTEPAFIRSETVRVGEDGSFAAAFDFSEYDPGDTFTVTVRHDDATIAEAEGRIVADGVPVTRTGTDATGSSAATTSTGGSTETTGPGFGVAAAAAALCVAAGAAARRRRRR
ncbi:BGTF surface domain-containing protein [Halobaculum sp. EA56]|uniref:BGTF surface domain-containing protein n=1 Tax=Halobaculum sp. EA56 TaxID=3421648 RepID=UPI003EB8F070